MSEEKFTRGPWSLLFNDKTKVVLEQQGVAVFVADTYAGFTKSEEEQKANAALISAAPEMYRKLEWLQREFDESDDEELVAIGWEIELILKKARGER